MHLATGYVVSTPEYFLMARPVRSDASWLDIVDPSVLFDKDKADCWHIYLMAGDMGKCWDHCPQDMKDYPFVSFERNNIIRILPMDRLRRLVLGC